MREPLNINSGRWTPSGSQDAGVLCSISRATFLGVLASPLLAVGSKAVLVVAALDVPANKEALTGLETELGAPEAVRVLNLAEEPAPRPAEQLRRIDPRLVVVLGSDALAAMVEVKGGPRRLASMVLRSDPHANAISSGVFLDLFVSDFLTELRAVFGPKGRVGMIYNPAPAGDSPPAKARLESLGLVVRECRAADGLVAALKSLKGKAEFVICLPDSALYNSTTMRPLLMASLENRLPLVGFSASFARAGAVMAVHPDYRDIGRQTGRLIQRQMAGSGLGAQEHPRKRVVTVNPRVARLLNLTPGESTSAGLAVEAVR